MRRAPQCPVRLPHLRGSAFVAAAGLRRRWAGLLLALACALITGCRSLHGIDGKLNYGAPGALENPLPLPPVDRELIWNHTVDAVDDYFRIQREERVRLVGGILTEGRIDTYPTIGSTIFEPWRRDSTAGYEKLLATLQSIRRRATVRLIPAQAGYLLDVVVQKELEDLDKPENASAGGATLRHDGSLVRIEGAAGRHSQTLGWIPIGRDCTLEQQILAVIQARLRDCAPLGDSPLPVDELPADLPAQTAPPEWRGPEPLPPALPGPNPAGLPAGNGASTPGGIPAEPPPRFGPPVAPSGPGFLAPPALPAPAQPPPSTGLTPQLNPASGSSAPRSPFQLPAPTSRLGPVTEPTSPAAAPRITEPLPAVVEPLPAP